MLKYFTITIFIFVIFFTVSAQNIYDNVKNAQQESYQAIYWNVEQGLGSSNSVNCMLKDVNGFLWIGTSVGLNRFDGSRFINYRADKNKSGIINDNHILSLVEDSLHNIWVGTFKGLSRYDIKADTFSNFMPPIDSTVLVPYTVPFWATNDEVFCVEMYNRITAYNIHSLKRRVVVRRFKNDWDNQLLRPACSVLNEHNNCVWMIAKTGLLQVSLTGKQTAYSFPSTRKVKFKGYWVIVMSMCYDDRRNLIWQNTSEGLIQFNLSDKKFYHINEFDKLVNEQPINQVYYMPAETMGLDLKGKVWIGTKPNGTLIYDPETHAIKQPFIANLQGNVLHDPPLYFSGDGIVWACGDGIYQLNPITPAVTQYTSNPSDPSSLSNHHVATMVTGPQSKIWMGTFDGINIFDPATGLFRVLKEKDLPGFHGKNIMPLAIDSSLHTTWLKAWPPEAFYEMDIATQKCRLIKVNDTTADHRFDIGNMAAEVARPYKNGFIFFMQGLGIFSAKKDSLVVQPLISFRHQIVRMVIVEDHWLFLRTPNDTHDVTYLEKDGKWLITPNALDSIHWRTIFFNKDDNTFWVGTSKEIIHYDKNFHLIRNYSDGFPGIDVLYMLTDNYGNVWFPNSHRTISRLNTKTGKYLTLSEKDGMQNKNIFWEWANIKDAYGNLYFACENGFYKITPGKFRDNYPSSSAYIQSISINQKPFPLPASANYVQQLSLNHNENNIAIEAGIIDYYSAGTSRIRYKLDGATSNWQYGSNQSIINFNALQPGNYKLMIQASNAVNEFNSPEKILWIHIHAAWWQTWWFFTIAVLTAGVALYGLIRWRLHQQFQSRLQQSEKEKQLAELKDKTSQLEMQALRSQMNPHFIFNCLNSINRFIINNNAIQAADYLTRFAKLIRIVLEQSGRSFVPLEDELKCLQLYMDLEALRFEIPFQYEINCNGTDISSVMIPTLLIQPFVENAIWHGLQGKNEGAGKIDINMSVKDDTLYCTICDNGIGRSAKVVKEKTETGKKSLGINLTEHRLQLIDPLQKEKVGIEIHDLRNDAGNNTGTCVDIKIPVKTI